MSYLTICALYQHVYRKGYICLHALYTSEDPNDLHCWNEAKSRTLPNALSSLRLMLSCTRKQIPNGVEFVHPRDPRQYRWHNEVLVDRPPPLTPSTSPSTTVPLPEPQATETQSYTTETPSSEHQTTDMPSPEHSPRTPEPSPHEPQATDQKKCICTIC